MNKTEERVERDAGTNAGAPDHDLNQQPRPLDGDGDGRATAGLGDAGGVVTVSIDGRYAGGRCEGDDLVARLLAGSTKRPEELRLNQIEHVR